VIDTEKLYAGRRFDIYAIRNKGVSIVQDFIEGLGESDKTKILALLKRAADHGPPRNKEKFKRIGSDIFEFKSYQVRILCAFDKGSIIILTHGFIKKRDKTPGREIEKAKKLMKMYMEGRRLK